VTIDGSTEACTGERARARPTTTTRRDRPDNLSVSPTKSSTTISELLAETLAGLKVGVERIRDPRAYDRRDQEIREIERKGLEAIQHDSK
jgi:hypothetical protein